MGNMDFGNTYDAVVNQTLETRRLSQGRTSHVHIDHIKIIDSTVIADLGGACPPVRAVANSAIRVIIEVRETHVCKTDYARQGQHYQSRRETWFDGKAPESEAENCYQIISCGFCLYKGQARRKNEIEMYVPFGFDQQVLICREITSALSANS